jgi:ribosome-binding factor A
MGHRLLRINESIKEILSSVITAEGLKDPRVGFVTVTGVETTPDLRHAKVFVSVLGKQDERDACMEALEHSRGYLQSRLNAASRMKRTPQLEFQYDSTLDSALHIEELMRHEAQELGAEAHEIPVPGAVVREEPAADEWDDEPMDVDDEEPARGDDDAGEAEMDVDDEDPA